MKTSSLDYDLPESLIAQHPAENRDESRLLVLNRKDGSMRADTFKHLAEYLRTGDRLVLNDTRVIRARLRGAKPTGGKVEVFLLREESPGLWVCLMRPSAKVRPGATVLFAGGLTAEAGDVLHEGRRYVRFDRPDVLSHLERVGEVPLPPYIHREHPSQPESCNAADLTRYQTVYAAKPGAVAAPTAGLHYTNSVFQSLEAAGVSKAHITLHVGYGTFKPVTAELLEDHRVDPEEFWFSEATAEALNATRADGGRIVAVGTTVTRVLETQHQDGGFVPGEGATDKYVFPPYEFRGVDALQTNFHLPRSSLLALVCAFAGTEFALEAYRYAVAEGFRFYSYGDTMLVL